MFRYKIITEYKEIPLLSSVATLPFIFALSPRRLWAVNFEAVGLALCSASLSLSPVETHKNGKDKLTELCKQNL